MWFPPPPPEATGAVDVVDNEDVVGVDEKEVGGKEKELPLMELGMGELVAKAPCPEAIKEGDGCRGIQALSI
jgi:hypothetical protein